MGEDRTVCVGLDTHKAKIAVAVAEPGRSGEVRFHGEIANQPDAVRRLIERLADKHGRLRVCYEAGPCGYGLQRQITALGHDCTVVAPSLVPRKPGDRVKTNRRDAVSAGPAASRRRAYARDDVAPLRVELSASIPRPRLRDRPRGGSPPPALKRYRPPRGSPNRGGPDEAVRGEAAGPGRAGQL